MGVRLPSVFTTTFIGPLPANSTETIVMTTPPLNTSLENAAVFINWFVRFVGGAGTTNAFFRLRRGNLVTSTQINPAVWNGGSGSGTNSLFSGVYVDQPGVVAGVQYTLTIVQNGATAAGTIDDVCMIASSL